MAKRAKASVIFVKKAGQLVPASAYDAECFEKHADGTEFDLASRTKRSNPQQRLYRGLLSKIVETTALGDVYATGDHLHDALVRELGYVTVNYDLAGNPYVTRDSTAFEEMQQHEFQPFLEKALARLAEVLGFDPAELLDERAAA